ncbi:cytochrome c oxidase subunit 3 [Ferviditalea candida]|uniref:Cytochrome c oxidase subunit 3 n=1 Tax=Ferviditalea candida TaxID=3108399 RepID=A0ABU5ZHN3_9BACL|nr:cytochrome c oxidase subunit 3 [Paenibacillaceae bacterium T2]
MDHLHEGVQSASGELSPMELKKMRGSLILVLFSLAIPLFVLIDVRVLMVGAYVSPEANQIIGLVAAVLMLVSWVTVGEALRGVKERNFKRVLSSIRLSLLLGFVSWLLIGVQVVNHSVNSLTHYGETFLVSLGTIDVYLLFGLAALLSVRMRVRNFGAAVDHQWGVYSTALYWRFTIIVWIVMYAVLYLV